MSSFRKPVQAFRYAAGTASGGYTTPASEVPFSIRASVQPSRPSDIELLPEGRREARVFRLYTSDTLNLLEGSEAKPDQVLLYGDRYEALAELPWQNNVINHNKYLVVKVAGNGN